MKSVFCQSVLCMPEFAPPPRLHNIKAVGQLIYRHIYFLKFYGFCAHTNTCRQWHWSTWGWKHFRSAAGRLKLLIVFDISLWIHDFRKGGVQDFQIKILQLKVQMMYYSRLDLWSTSHQPTYYKWSAWMIYKKAFVCSLQYNFVFEDRFELPL